MKLISLNIERLRHLDRVIPFLELHFAQGDTVACIQEIYQSNFNEIKQKYDLQGIYMPMCKYKGSDQEGNQGIAVLTNAQIQEHDIFVYYKDREELPTHYEKIPLIHAGVIVATVNAQDVDYRIATTHFPIAPNGGTNQAQAVSLKALLPYLEQYQDLILCGDFNAPRGRKVFTQIATLYKDNIPPEVTTTIDGNFHKAGNLPYVVDGLFTTDHYSVDGIEIVDGLSDHKGIVARISKEV